MSFTYRLLQPDEEEQLLDVWMAVYPETERGQWQREYHAISHAPERTFVAATEDGHLLATLLYWVRSLRAGAGHAQRVGLVSHVATRPEARRQGHASALLQLALKAMVQHDCAWSLLFTSEEARSLYERHGWRGYPTTYRQGLLAAERSGTQGSYLVQPYDPRTAATGWQPLATVYDAYNATRLLSVVREPIDWHGYLGLRIIDWLDNGATCFVARRAPNEAICGYALVHCSEFGFLLNELAVLPSEIGAIVSLFTTIAASYPKDQQVGGRVILPADPAIEQGLQSIFAALATEHVSTLMARPLAAGLDHQTLASLITAPTAFYWQMDEV